MSRIYAGTLGLTAFATFIARGLLHSGGTGVVVEAAVALIAFAAIGWLIGLIAEQTIRDSVEATFNAEVAEREVQQKKAV